MAPSKPSIAWTGARVGSEDGLRKWFVLWSDNDKNEQGYELYRREKRTDPKERGGPTRPHKILSVGSSPQDREARNRQLRHYDEFLEPGMTYCYYAVTVGETQSRRGPEACFDFTARRARRGHPPPQPLEVEYANSKRESFVLIRYRHRVDPGSKKLRGVRVFGAPEWPDQGLWRMLVEKPVEVDEDSDRRLRFDLPDRINRYCYAVQSFNEYGDSEISEKHCGSVTLKKNWPVKAGDPDRERPWTPATERPAIVGEPAQYELPGHWVQSELRLKRQPPQESLPFIYSGQLEIDDAVLRRIRVVAPNAVRFIHGGRDPSRCLHDVSVVRTGNLERRAPPKVDLGESQMKELWGSETPPSNTPITACVEALDVEEVQLLIWYEEKS